MKIRIGLLTLIFFSQSLNANVIPMGMRRKNIEGFDRPISFKQTVLGKSEYRKLENAILNCWVYPRFAILEFDLGNIGAEKYIIRSRRDNSNLNKLCAQRSKVGGMTLDAQGYFVGAVDRFIFDIAPDPPVLENVLVVDAFTGTTVLELNFSSERKFKIEKSNGRIKLSFYHPLKLSCMPTSQSCWRKIVVENRIDSKIKISMPNCAEILRKNPDIHTSSSLRITTAAQIDDLANPKVRFVGGDSTCELMP